MLKSIMNIIAGITILACIPGPVVAAEDARQSTVITVGIFPREPAKMLLPAFTPLARYLESALGKKVSLVFSKDFASFMEKLEHGDFDVVHMNHTHYVKTRNTVGYEVVAMNRENGSAELRAALYVRKDSPVVKITDLRGKTIIFGGDQNAFIANQVGHKLLQDAGLSPGSYHEQQAINPPSAVIALARGQGDAAVAGDMVIKRPIVKEAGADTAVRMVAVSEPYPGLPWAVRKSLGSDFKSAVKKALLSLSKSEEGRLILKTAGIEGFAMAEDSQYDAVVDVIRPTK